MKKITDHLRVFARESKDNDWEPTDLNKPIRDSLILLTQKLKVNDIRIKLELDGQLPKIFGDASQLESIFQNLLTNSRDAFDEVTDGRKKVIAISTQILDQSTVSVEYEDNATGIAPEIIDRVFDPFFTTKEVGKGTGLGMSILHGIIQQHKGTIKMDSALGRGTKFTLTFPSDKRAAGRKEPKAAPKKVEPVVRKKAGPMPSLLIVDDETGIAQLLKLMLKDVFKTKAFSDPREACTEIATRRYDLIITDFQMPHVSGMGILAKVKECQPDTPVVIMTGRGDADPQVKKALAEGALGILDKPFSSPKIVRGCLLAYLAAGKPKSTTLKAA